METGLISFSEGTRFTPQKYAESHTYCTTHNPPLPVPQHLLYPRTKGFVSTIQQLRQAQHITAVYDFTLAYERNGRWLLAPSFADSIAFGDLSTKRGYRFHIHVRRCDMEEMPRDDGELRDWLERVWIEKGEWLEAKRMEWARKRIGG